MGALALYYPLISQRGLEKPLCKLALSSVWVGWIADVSWTVLRWWVREGGREEGTRNLSGRRVSVTCSMLFFGHAMPPAAEFGTQDPTESSLGRSTREVPQNQPR